MKLVGIDFFIPKYIIAILVLSYRVMFLKICPSWERRYFSKCAISFPFFLAKEKYKSSFLTTKMEYIRVHVFQKAYGPHIALVFAIKSRCFCVRKKSRLKKSRTGISLNWCSKLYQSLRIELCIAWVGVYPLFLAQYILYARESRLKLHKIRQYLASKILWVRFLFCD